MRVAATTISPTPIEPIRTPTSGHTPACEPACPSSAKKMPNIAPVASASPTNFGVTTRVRLPPLMLTRPIATIARRRRAAPAATASSAVTRPTTSGISAEVTALIGAKTAIAPCDSPR